MPIMPKEAESYCGTQKGTKVSRQLVRHSQQVCMFSSLRLKVRHHTHEGQECTDAAALETSGETKSSHFCVPEYLLPTALPTPDLALYFILLSHISIYLFLHTDPLNTPTHNIQSRYSNEPPPRLAPTKLPASPTVLGPIDCHPDKRMGTSRARPFML